MLSVRRKACTMFLNSLGWIFVFASCLILEGKALNSFGPIIVGRWENLFGVFVATLKFSSFILRRLLELIVGVKMES